MTSDTDMAYQEDPDEFDQPVRVKVIHRKKGLSLVEYMGDLGLDRVYVPTESLYEDGEETYSNAVYYGSPYGVPWAEMVGEEGLVLNPDILQTELRRYGVWTYSDFVQQPEAVRAAINQALKDLTSTLKANALAYEQHHEGSN